MRGWRDKRTQEGGSPSQTLEKKRKENWVSRSVLSFYGVRLCCVGAVVVVVEEASPRIGACGANKKKKKGKKTVEQIILNLF
jgi:hypothetical protein